MKNLNSRNTSKTHPNRNRGESYSASASTVLCWQTQELKFLNSKKFQRGHLPNCQRAKIFPPQPQHENKSRQTTESGRINVSTSHRAVPHGWVSSAILPANYRLSTALAKTWELSGPFSAAPRPSVRPILHTLSPSHLSLRTRAGQAREITQLAASCPKVPEGGSGRCRFSRHCRPAMATRAGRRWKTDRSRDKLSSRPFP